MKKRLIRSAVPIYLAALVWILSGLLLPMYKLSSILLAFELFGGEGMPLFALCCGVSYMLSGYYSLYSEQKIVYSKFRTEWIDQKAK